MFTYILVMQQVLKLTDHVIFRNACFMIAVIASINCGETETKTDVNQIEWTPDDTLISNGVARVVQSSNSLSPILDTLRVFTTRKKNCYTNTDVMQGDKVLVRAWFHYGNYDRLSNPPTFDLHFDGNFWATVDTSSGLKMYEAIYVTKRDQVSVCVAQTKPNQFPFMSALEIRSLDSEAYADVDDYRALFLNRRLSYGASQALR